MPNRILRESICTSEDVDNLSTEAEVLFYRLIVQADDFGRADGRPSIIRARCFPLRLDRVQVDDVAAWLAELVAEGMVLLYEVDGKPYLQLTGWDKHQHRRAQTSKFPQPLEDACFRVQAQADSPEESRNRGIEESIKNSPAPVGASVENGNGRNPFAIDDHQQGLLLRLWERRPEWADGKGALTYGGLVALMKRYGAGAVNEALVDLTDHAADVKRPYPYLEKVAKEFSAP